MVDDFILADLLYDVQPGYQDEVVHQIDQLADATERDRRYFEQRFKDEIRFRKQMERNIEDLKEDDEVLR